jgi:hypothetical protein
MRPALPELENPIYAPVIAYAGKEAILPPCPAMGFTYAASPLKE